MTIYLTIPLERNRNILLRIRPKCHEQTLLHFQNSIAKYLFNLRVRFNRINKLLKILMICIITMQQLTVILCYVLIITSLTQLIKVLNLYI